ncbi:EAL domain-containing protein [Fontimonas sp. SYSU GA230001]|uniref:EAL domain-containing protein n=1 Tax=Fontimonas sp. SYSU GA230001 TaxID=3142450 RepID=UPI0032B48811
MTPNPPPLADALGRWRTRLLYTLLLLAVLGSLCALLLWHWGVALVGGSRPLLAALQTALFLVFAGVAWWLAVARPFARLPIDAPAAESGAGAAQLQALQHERDKRAEQLNAMLQMNRTMRDKLARLGAEQQLALRARDALLGATQDPLILTDGGGVVLGVSPAAATALRRAREDLVGKRFEDVVPLFQSGVDAYENHPLPRFLAGVLESRSGIPQIQQAVLLTADREPVTVFVTAGAILDGAGQVIGSTVRFARVESAAAEPTAVPTLSLADAEIGSWAAKLLSREPFERRVEDLIADSHNTGAQHMLLYLRVDDLERINDQAGYWAGEQALWHAAKNFSLALVDAGTGYRCTNNRFATLLIGCDETRALAVAERIRSHAENNELVWEGKRFPCTFSIAVLPVDRDTPKLSELLGAAETLLSEARRRGGNCVLHKIPDEAVKTRQRDDQTWLDWLLPRLDNGRAHLISQETHSLAQPPLKPLLEFFIRVEDDDGVWLEPGHYLPAIERLRQSHRLDLWSLQHLLEALSRDMKLFETHGLASLNLAPQTLLDDGFAEQAFETLAGSMVPAERLCFEIDEAFALSQSSVVQRFMERLRPLGLRFALDRCHTTTGITQLRRLPIDYMKIHPQITRNIEDDALDRTHLEWICQAAHLLGRKTVAINIESPAALALLRGAGVDYVQGSAVNKMGPVMT